MHHCIDAVLGQQVPHQVCALDISLYKLHSSTCVNKGTRAEALQPGNRFSQGVMPWCESHLEVGAVLDCVEVVHRCAVVQLVQHDNLRASTSLSLEYDMKIGGYIPFECGWLEEQARRSCNACILLPSDGLRAHWPPHSWTHHPTLSFPKSRLPCQEPRRITFVSG